jgi:hypothetical protein
VEHLLGIPAGEVAAAAAEDEQGVAGDQVVSRGEVKTGRSRGVAWGVQEPDLGFAELQRVAAVVQFRPRQRAAPELRLGLQQMEPRTGGRFEDLFDAVDVVVVAVGEQQVGDRQALVSARATISSGSQAGSTTAARRLAMSSTT